MTANNSPNVLNLVSFILDNAIIIFLIFDGNKAQRIPSRKIKSPNATTIRSIINLNLF